MTKTKKPSTKKTSTKPAAEAARNSRRTKRVTEILGWYGAAAILSAYGLASFSAVSVHSPLYLILNFTGALGIMTVATAKHVRQSIVVNAFWASMAALSLIKIILVR